ncbi:hypothetical protein [Xenophilus azovorans]|uniref:hypothetical protein n=1 Tax=Xenophilus azovorans TaxID=151755 RepID=UPI00056F51D9|nr:hypothetical protein [Xenophilus azovorans]
MSSDHSWALIFDARLHNIAEVHRPALPTGLDDGPPLPFEQAVLLMRFAPQLAALVREVAAAPADRPFGFQRGRDVRHRARTLWREIALDLQRVADSASGDAG